MSKYAQEKAKFHASKKRADNARIAYLEREILRDANDIWKPAAKPQGRDRDLRSMHPIGALTPAASKLVEADKRQLAKAEQRAAKAGQKAARRLKRKRNNWIRDFQDGDWLIYVPCIFLLSFYTFISLKSQQQSDHKKAEACLIAKQNQAKLQRYVITKRNPAPSGAEVLLAGVRMEKACH